MFRPFLLSVDFLFLFGFDSVHHVDALFEFLDVILGLPAVLDDGGEVLSHELHGVVDCDKTATLELVGLLADEVLND